MPISEVHNIDCLEYMKTIPDKFFDLCIADPPYGINNGKWESGHLKKYGQLRTVNGYIPSHDIIDQIKRVSKNVIIWGYNHLASKIGDSSHFIFWYKHNPLPSFADGELAYTSFEGPARCFDYRYYSNLNADKNRIHPTQKPIALYNWILDNYAMGGVKSLTHFLGVEVPGLRLI